MSVIEAHKESERLIMSQVEEVDEFYHFLTGQKDWCFTDDYRAKMRGIIKKFGFDTVIETAKEVVDKYGTDGIKYLIPFTISKHDPKSKAKYICGIIKNKTRGRWLNKDQENTITSVVSDIVDSYGVACLDKIIEQIKRFNFDYFYEYADKIYELFENYAPVADYSQCSPQMKAATGVAVPDTTRAELAYIEDSDGSVPRVEVVNQLTKDDMVKAQYEAALLVKYAGKVDEWHIISKAKYNWTGWADIVEAEEAERIKQGQKPRTVRVLKNREEMIRRSVEAHRAKLGIQR